MKKILLSIMVIAVLGVVAVQHADAGRGWYGNPGAGCPNWGCGYNYGYNQIPDSTAQKNMETFLQATSESRKQLVMKQAELQALMNSDNPDPAKAATLTGEIFQLRDQIRTKAVESGFSPGFGRGGNYFGNRWRSGFGPGYGYGPGGGRGVCRGFMY